MKKLKIEDFILDEIESIELCGEIDTIDITVEDTHMFFANDIYTHNSAINESKFDLKVISESLGKAQTADVILGVGRSDDDKKIDRAELLVLKNRNGADGFSEPMHFATSNIDIYMIDPNQHSIGIQGINEDIAISEQIRENNSNKNFYIPDEFEDTAEFPEEEIDD